MSYTDRFNIGERGDLPERQGDLTPMHGGDLFVPLMREGNFITNTSVLMRRALFEQLGGFYTGLNGTEDWDLWIRVAERHPIGVVPEPLVKYRFHGGSISRNYERMSRERTQVIARGARPGARPGARLDDAPADLGGDLAHQWLGRRPLRRAIERADRLRARRAGVAARSDALQGSREGVPQCLIDHCASPSTPAA